MKKKVPKRIENIIMNALQAGVVPRTGLGYIAVGREQEIATLLKDVEMVEEGAGTFRFVTGSYGSGKTFLLQTIKEYAMNKGFVVADADLSPDRSLVGTVFQKRGLATYRELMCNLSTQTSPTGGALGKILDVWLNEIWVDVAKNVEVGGIQGNALEDRVANKIYETILNMQEMVHGYDFANILIMYWKASRVNDAELKSKALRWLRGEYATKSEAKVDLGVATIINDNDWYEYIKLLSEFLVKIGYKGFFIIIDELINIYASTSAITRHKNYEKILAMYNDIMRGKARHLGIIMGGTPQAIEDLDRGLYSYDALKSRLESGRFGSNGMINLMQPVIKISPLTKEEIVVLLENIAEMHADIYGYTLMITIEDIIEFVKDALREKRSITPRSIIRDFIEVLNLLYQNKNFSLKEIMENFNYSKDVERI
ncbi:ATP-binding protein [Sporofaciens sp. SGI.106]|uniref:ATP-binding protein n=1 Tax=Sporofaciens sp. SGI.106 TaxID=3420568 RepID=UPI003D061D7D